jgi:hypothetical protein
MEHLYRKDHETSATIAEAGGLAVRIAPQHPTKVVGRECALHRLSDALHSYQPVLISALSEWL